MLGKKEVFITRDLSRCDMVRKILSNAGIESFVRMNSMGNPDRYHGVPLVDSSVAYEYRIYVRKKDYDFAKSIMFR